MKFTKPMDYDSAPTLPEQAFQRLPRGGYVAKILTVEEAESKAGNPYLVFNLDIAEGEYVGFFGDDYQKQSGEKKWHFTHRLMIPTNKTKPFTLHMFKTFNVMVEESNPGFQFSFDLDEKQYRGKLIGVLVNEREYRKRDGSIGTLTNIAKIVKASTIRNGSYTIPSDERLKGSGSGGNLDNGSGFVPVPDNTDDDDLPFN